MKGEENRIEEEFSYLQTSLQGDIREDISFLGLTILDLVWIVSQSIIVISLAVFLPLNILVKSGIVTLAVSLIFLNRFLKGPYRRKRLLRYWKQPKEIDGSKMDEALGITEDGPFYRSGREWQMVFRVDPPPWETAVLQQKKQMIQSYGEFLRACMQRKVDVMIEEDFTPDFLWDIWNVKRATPSATQGIEQLKMNRLDYFERIARENTARRAHYHMRLSVNETNLPLQQREGEEGLSKEQIERKRIIEDLREICGLTNILLKGELKSTLLTGFAVTEVISKQWAPLSWRLWKANQETWEQEQPDLALTEEKEPQGATSIVNHVELNEPVTRWERFKINWNMILNKVMKFCRHCFSYIRWNRFKSKGKEPNTASPDIPVLPAALEITAELDIPLNDATDDSFVEEIYDSKREIENDLQEEYCLILTSPASTGRSFLLANLAAANARENTPVIAIDLSKDVGSISYLNPSLEGISGCWEHYTTRLVPGLSLYVMCKSRFASADEIEKQIREWFGQGKRVIVDLPWDHPYRDQLLKVGTAVAIIDTDYHHWVRWNEVIQDKQWEGEIWINQSEIEMSGLVQNEWRKEASRLFPTFSDARKSLYRGRPLALDAKEKHWFSLGKGKSHHALIHETNH